jgi:hypothetical protein
MIISSKSHDLGKTQITDKIRVSSAALYYQADFGDYYQYETWIFSDDIRQRSKQVIHGTSLYTSKNLEDKTKKVHKYISDNLLKWIHN